jgi:flavodoxin
MKSLVVFYSFEGDTRLIGQTIGKEIDADILELDTVVKTKSKDYMKNVIAEKQVLMKTKPKLKEYQIKIDDYDLIFIGTPIWSSTFTPALRTYFSQETIKGKKIALYYCYTVKEGRIVEYLEKELEGNTILGSMGFQDPLKNDVEKVKEKAVKFAKRMIKKV